MFERTSTLSCYFFRLITCCAKADTNSLSGNKAQSITTITAANVCKYHSHEKRKDSLEGSLVRLLFVAEREVLKILIPRFPSSFSLARNRIYLDTQLKEELIDLFWKLAGYSLFPHRQSRQRMVTKSILFTHFYYKPDLYLQQAGNTLALNPQLFCQQVDKKHPLVK